MNTSLKMIGLALAASGLLAACGEVEDTRPGQPVKTRQVAFKEILRVFEPMGIMLREKRYDPEPFLEMARVLQQRSQNPWTHFGPDTNYPPTKSTPAVWEKTAEFEQERDTYLKRVDTLLAAAEGRHVEEIDAAYKRVYDSCQSCHKPFKAR